MSALSAKDDEVPFDSGLAVSIACITLNVIAKIGQRRAPAFGTEQTTDAVAGPSAARRKADAAPAGADLSS
jgi:hypothetical protein